MTKFVSLLQSLINENYTLKVKTVTSKDIRAWYVVTDDKLPGWSCQLKYEDFPEDRKIVLTSGNGFYSKVYEEDEWKDVLENIFFMCHCIEK